ncbi:hypothetical protein MMC16_003695 [Acarospora aff. strigata]|nr:hypothetical protein [Acarospora aff. strigata]
MPVCDGCIVKASFGKQENTFQNRLRYFCNECWLSGNRHAERQIDKILAESIDYVTAAGSEAFCSCTPSDGRLCLRCKDEQKDGLQSKPNKCCGQYNTLEVYKAARRICLWCGKPLVGKPTRNEARRIYDSRHIYAKMHLDVAKPAFVVGWDIDGPFWNDEAESSFELLGPHPRLHPSNRTTAPYRKYLRHLGEVNYDATDITPPSITCIKSSIRGYLKYDIDFLLQFRWRCDKALASELQFRPVYAEADLPSILPWRPTTRIIPTHATPINKPPTVQPALGELRDMEEELFAWKSPDLSLDVGQNHQKVRDAPCLEGLPDLSLEINEKSENVRNRPSAGDAMDQLTQVPLSHRIRKTLLRRFSRRPKRTQSGNEIQDSSRPDNDSSWILVRAGSQRSGKSCGSDESLSVLSSTEVSTEKDTQAVWRSMI